MKENEKEAPKPLGPTLRAVVVVLAVIVAPFVVLVAAVVNGLLKWRPDRAVAWLVAVIGAVGAAAVLLLVDYPAAVGRVLVGWWRASWVPSSVHWPAWVPVGWLRANWPGAPSWLDLWRLLAVGLAGGAVLGALWWRWRQHGRERDLYDGAEAREAREATEDRRRRLMTHRAHEAQNGPSWWRLAWHPYVVPLGDRVGPFLGRYQRGDLGGRRHAVHRRREDAAWRSGEHVRLPLAASGGLVQHVVLLGRTGMGKSEAVFAWAEWALSQSWQVIYISAKEPPNRAESAALRLIAVADSLGKSSRPLSSEYPYDPLRGDHDARRDRLVAVVDWKQDYWREVANLLIDLAMFQADQRGQSVEALPELVYNLTPTVLKRMSPDTHPSVPALINALGDPEFSGAVVRYGSMAVHLRGWIASREAGGWSFEDADMIAVELPTSSRKAAGQALLRVMMRDLNSYLADPTRRQTTADGKPRPILLVIEEVGAVSKDAVVGAEFRDLVERARAAGARSVFTAQGPSGLGDEETQESLFTNGTVVTFRQPFAAELLAMMPGTQRVHEASRAYSDDGMAAVGSSRRQHSLKLSPNYLKGLARGEAVVISGPEFCSFVAGMRPRPVPPDVALAMPETRPAVGVGQAVAELEGPGSDLSSDWDES